MFTKHLHAESSRASICDMTYSEVLAYYKTHIKIAKTLKLSRASITRWRKENRVPDRRQYQLEEKTRGKLKRSKNQRKEVGSNWL